VRALNSVATLFEPALDVIRRLLIIFDKEDTH
jgi:hypothetical protein